ncbi:MAG: hypothetical protein AAF401_07475, partial [Pseudomonadota bacterium]
MVDEAKAKAAKERLEAAKKAAEEAEVVDAVEAKNLDEAIDDAADKAQEIVEDAGEKPDPAAESEEIAAEDEAAPEATSDDKPDETGGESEQAPDAEDQPEVIEEADETEEQSATSLSAMALRVLAILVVGAIAALWAAPRIAPHLPAFAQPVAAFLSPGTNVAGEAVGALRSDTEAMIAQQKGEGGAVGPNPRGAASAKITTVPSVSRSAILKSRP